MRKNRIQNSGDLPSGKGCSEVASVPWEYNEYMKLMMLLSVSQEDLLKRIQNIIQMESAQQYRTQHQFKLDRAYTYIYSKADVTLNPMFHLDTLTKNGLFRFHREAYSGY